MQVNNADAPAEEEEEEGVRAEDKETAGIPAELNGIKALSIVKRVRLEARKR